MIRGLSGAAAAAASQAAIAICQSSFSHGTPAKPIGRSLSVGLAAARSQVNTKAAVVSLFCANAGETKTKISTDASAHKGTRTCHLLTTREYSYRSGKPIPRLARALASSTRRAYRGLGCMGTGALDDRLW